ncbi:MAG: glutamine synthetase type III, partial [Eubacteriales bacterium]
IFTTTNIATDHNQLIMDCLKKIALRHNLVCLLHEKPFAGVNGSGKHNNWSLSTNEGVNLLEPGKTPHENAQFLTFLCAVIKAVDDYAELLRVSAANPGNDHRLGANEAPPAIISMFLGDQLTDIVNQIENGGATSTLGISSLEIGVSTLPNIPKDNSDRNRTSPFAFTGNKFEFRMFPSSASIACPNMILNTIVAEIIDQIATKLEKASDFNKELQNTLQKIIKDHKRIIFNGNNYSEEWLIEAKKRGLPNISSMVESLPHYISEKSLKVFEKHHVLSNDEVHSRYEILLEQYSKVINIEAKTMIDLANRNILPATTKYASNLAQSIQNIKAVSSSIETGAQEDILNEISSNLNSLRKNAIALENKLKSASEYEDDSYKLGVYYRDTIFPTMNDLRINGDKLETLVDAALWPLPTYAEMLFLI